MDKFIPPQVDVGNNVPMLSTATIGDVSQSYTHSPPIAGLCLGVSSASSKLAQPGLGLNPASPRKALGKWGTLSVSYILSPWSVYGDFVG